MNPLKPLLCCALVCLLGAGPVAADELTPLQQLGKHLFFDNISDPPWMSCATCHAPAAGWTGTIPGINLHGGVYRGAVPQRFGDRKPPSSAYATRNPVFGFDEASGEFVGGSFWDGRATGERLGNPAADQALGPYLNPVGDPGRSTAATSASRTPTTGSGSRSRRTRTPPRSTRSARSTTSTGRPASMPGTTQATAAWPKATRACSTRSAS
jgi:hypothetical protein